jgi:hypothetical protein
LGCLSLLLALTNCILDQFHNSLFNQVVRLPIAVQIEFANLNMIQVKRGAPLAVMTQAQHSRLLVDNLKVRQFCSTTLGGSHLSINATYDAHIR